MLGRGACDNCHMLVIRVSVQQVGSQWDNCLIATLVLVATVATPPTMGIKVFEKNLAQGEEFCSTTPRFDSSNNPLNTPNIVLIRLSYYHI